MRIYMLGALYGDIVGSRFEVSGFNRYEFVMFLPTCHFTDDSLMTFAVAETFAVTRNDRSDYQKILIRKMKEIFIKYLGKTNSDILNDYIDYVGHIYRALKCEDGNDITKWQIHHWKGYVENNLKEFHNPDESYVWVGNYQGRYCSINYQKRIKNNDSLVIEIFIRDQNIMSATLHHAFFDSGDPKHRKWSIKELKETSEDVLKAKRRLRDDLRKYIDNASKENKLIKKVKSNAFNTFGKFAETKTATSLKEADKIIKEWFDEFIKIVDDFS